MHTECESTFQRCFFLLLHIIIFMLYTHCNIPLGVQGERFFFQKKNKSATSPFQHFYHCLSTDFRTSLVAQTVECLPTVQETQVRSLGWKDPLEKAMATHSSTLAWKIPWMEKRGRLQPTGLQRVRHDWATSLSFFYFLWTLLLCVSSSLLKDRGFAEYRVLE